jgi:hypothetical protein
MSVAPQRPNNEPVAASKPKAACLEFLEVGKVFRFEPAACYCEIGRQGGKTEHLWRLPITNGTSPPHLLEGNVTLKT